MTMNAGEGAKNRDQFARQMPEPPYDVNNRIDMDEERFLHLTECNLLGECRKKTILCQQVQ